MILATSLTQFFTVRQIVRPFAFCSQSDSKLIFLALYSVLAPCLQAIFETRKAINYFAIGVLVKGILQLPLIIFLGALGPVISTAIGLG